MIPPPPYAPSPKIIASSRLTAPELVSHFEDFKDTLQYAINAPELVFERLVLNLSESIMATLQLESEANSSVLKASEETTAKLEEVLHELRAIQEAKEHLIAELAQLKESILARGPSNVVAVRDAVKANPVIGKFQTVELCSVNESSHTNSKTISFAKAYTMIPGMVAGLTALNIGRHTNARVKTYTSEIMADRFTIHVDSWMETKLFGAGCAWLVMEADDMDFQYGSYSTLEDHDWSKYPMHNTRQITFKRPFSAVPKVVVWLSIIDVGHGDKWCIKCFATNVTATGFKIHIDSWANSRLYSAMASWVAYPADKSGVASGCFNTEDTRSWAQPQLSNSAFEAFGSGVFEQPPKVFLALNALQMDRKSNMTLKVSANNVSATGMTWHLDAWNDSILYSAGASYIALR